ncbi:glycosyl hydrolase family 17 [Cryomorphaceae bacterium]|nr:glycosyl hydrolase family 17 [Cryomorphaceae bacterium]
MKGIQVIFVLSLSLLCACGTMPKPTAKDILGNPDYTAIAYGGYRNQDRSVAPSVEEIKEDLKILSALGIRILRTYHARLYDHTPRLLQAIREMKEEEPNFEMYVMLGAWMQCENAWTSEPIHDRPDATENEAEILQAIDLANEYPDIVKIIAVGNESMVHWAWGYYVHPRIILKEVLRLQELKAKGDLPSDLWITTSDNFASWGGGDGSYHLPALDSLIMAVDYLSVHSYPFHDTHYDPDWWWMPVEQESWTKKEQIAAGIDRSVQRVKSQIEAVSAYMQSLEVDKPIHVGETGWATADNELYDSAGSGAADEYKEMLYHDQIRTMLQDQGMSCFYFEAFDEPWKGGDNPGGSENHFGLITVDGVVKMALWDAFDEGDLDGLTRGGHALRKSLDGKAERALELASVPTTKSEESETEE